MLHNACLFANFGFRIAENETAKDLQNFAKFRKISPSLKPAVMRCATALKGGEMAGDLGWFGRGSSKQPKAFEDAAFALEVSFFFAENKVCKFLRARSRLYQNEILQQYKHLQHFTLFLSSHTDRFAR